MYVCMYAFLFRVEAEIRSLIQIQNTHVVKNRNYKNKTFESALILRSRPLRKVTDNTNTKGLSTGSANT